MKHDTLMKKNKINCIHMIKVDDLFKVREYIDIDDDANRAECRFVIVAVYDDTILFTLHKT